MGQIIGNLGTRRNCRMTNEKLALAFSRKRSPFEIGSFRAAMLVACVLNASCADRAIDAFSYEKERLNTLARSSAIYQELANASPDERDFCSIAFDADSNFARQDYEQLQAACSQAGRPAQGQVHTTKFSIEYQNRYHAIPSYREDVFEELLIQTGRIGIELPKNARLLSRPMVVGFLCVETMDAQDKANISCIRPDISVGGSYASASIQKELFKCAARDDENDTLEADISEVLSIANSLSDKFGNCAARAIREDADRWVQILASLHNEEERSIQGSGYE